MLILYFSFSVLPYEDPVIKGLYSQYQLGDLVNLTCSYGPSKPNASLTWYINDRKVSTILAFELVDHKPIISIATKQLSVLRKRKKINVFQT